MKTTISVFTRVASIHALAFAMVAEAAGGTFKTKIQKTFPIPAGGKLIVDADRGSIEIAKGSADNVEVKVSRKLKAGTQAEADQIFNDHTITFDQGPNLLTVRASSKDKEGVLRKFWKRDQAQLQVQYLISIPEKFSVDSSTSGGTVTVCDLEGEVKARTSGGSLRIGNIQGSVWGKTSGGDIAVLASSGPVEVRTSGGSISIKKSQGPVVAHTSGGDIEVLEAQTTSDLGTSGGSIRVGKGLGKIVARTSGGNIDVKEGHSTIDASTSGGSITVTLAANPDGDSRFHTSGGDIHLAVTGNLNARVDARATGGRVVSEIPVTVEGEKKSGILIGKLGQGGSLVTLRTSGGSIMLKKSEKM